MEDARRINDKAYNALWKLACHQGDAYLVTKVQFRPAEHGYIAKVIRISQFFAQRASDAAVCADVIATVNAIRSADQGARR